MDAPPYVTIPEAAKRLGLSRSAVRRRLAAGKLRGKLEHRPQGTVWLIEFPDGPDVAAATSPPNATSPAEAPGDITLTVQAQRAFEMARYSAALLAPLHTQLAALAEENGRLKAELTAARARPSAPPAEGQTGRSWWRRLVWG